MKKLVCWLIAVAVLGMSSVALAGGVTGDVMLRLNLVHTSTNALSTASETLPTVIYDRITNGVSSNAMNQIYYTSRTLAANATDSLDLCGGVTDSFGIAATMTHMRLLLIGGGATNAGNIAVGGLAANPISVLFGNTNDWAKVAPGAWLMWYCPTALAYSNTASVADTLMISNTAASVGTYSIYVGGSL